MPVQKAMPEAQLPVQQTVASCMVSTSSIGAVGSSQRAHCNAIFVEPGHVHIKAGPGVNINTNVGQYLSYTRYIVTCIVKSRILIGNNGVKNKILVLEIRISKVDKRCNRCKEPA
jgi:hypothetical protein